MSFTRTIRDIESVEPSELNGIATGDLPADGNSSGVQVSNVGGTILFELAEGGDGVTLTIQGTAPTSPTAGALWYDNTGDDENLTSQLYIATVVADGEDPVWVPASPAPSVPSLPAMTAAGNYQLTVGDDSSLSWTAITDDGGGGGGGSGGTYTTDSNYLDVDADSLVIPSAGRWRFRIQSHELSHPRSGFVFTPACTSGFTNITGGYYEWISFISTASGETGTYAFDLTPIRKAYAEWNSTTSLFEISTVPIVQGRNFGNGIGLRHWSAEYSGSGTLANDECMFGTAVFPATGSTTLSTGPSTTFSLVEQTIPYNASIVNAGQIPANTYTNGLSTNGSVMTGELNTSGPVTISFYGDSSGVALRSANRPRIILNQIA